MTPKRLGTLWILVLLAIVGGKLYAAPATRRPAAEEAISVIRQTCSGYAGPYNCYPSLSAWENDYGGIDFGVHDPGDLVAADKIAVARIEGYWTQADAAPLSLGGWTTDADHYLTIYTTAEARHNGTAGSGYRLAPSSSSDRPIYSSVAHLRVEGLEIYGGAFNGTLVYLNPSTAAGVGEIHLNHNLIHGNSNGLGAGIHNYSCEGTLKIWNNIIYSVGDPGYVGAIQTEGGTAYLYNNTIVEVTSGFAIRSAGGVTIVKNNLTESPNQDFYGSFHPDSDFNASADDSAPGWHSRHDQTFAFVNRGGDNFHLATTDQGARHHGLDLSADPVIHITDDIDGEARSGAWDIGADEELASTDTMAPIRFDGAPAGTLPSDTTTVTLSISTNEAADCRYATIPDTAYAAMTEVFTTTGQLQHTKVIIGLVDEASYGYYVKCQDSAGNANADDAIISFDIASGDTVPPVISNVTITQLTPYSAQITWDTDEGTSSQLEYGRTDAYGRFTAINSALTLTHSVTLLGLDPSTSYHFRARSRDIAYNETMSDDQSFSTVALSSNLYYVDQNHPAASDANAGNSEDLPWLTIQHAADTLQAGDTAIVKPGSYSRVNITSSGTSSDFITFKGASVPDQSLVNPDALYNPHNPSPVPGNPAVNAVARGFELNGAQYIRLENFEITDISGRSGVHLIAAENVQVVGNFIHDLNTTLYDHTGVRGSGHDNRHILVKNNTLYRVQATGISIVGENWLVEDNELSHGLDTWTDTGVDAGGDVDAVRFFGSGHIIRNNYFHDYLDEEQLGDPHIDCFQTFSVYPESQFAHDILVEGNTCFNFGQMLMSEDQSEREGGENAIHHFTFRNNVFQRTRAVAIIVSGRTDHFTFENNVVAEAHYGALSVTGGSHHVTVRNNIFFNNGGGSQLSDFDSKVGSIWDFNLHYPDFDWPHKQPEYDQHSLFGVDPRFVNPAAGDFHLRVDSPAIDRGTHLTTFNYDLDGTERPQLAGWDLGAYEAVPELDLSGRPGDQTIYLDWTVNTTSGIDNWLIEYYTQTITAPLTSTEALSTTRSTTLTGLQNYAWYTVTVSALSADSTVLVSDTTHVMPTDRFVILPLVMRGY